MLSTIEKGKEHAFYERDRERQLLSTKENGREHISTRKKRRGTCFLRQRKGEKHAFYERERKENAVYERARER